MVDSIPVVIHFHNFLFQTPLASGSPLWSKPFPFLNNNISAKEILDSTLNFKLATLAGFENLLD